MTKRQINAIDRQIDTVVRARCSGIPINIMDIGKVFAAGRAAAAAGADVETAVVQAYEALAVIPR
jgi:hypothetical protein